MFQTIQNRSFTLSSKNNFFSNYSKHTWFGIFFHLSWGKISKNLRITFYSSISVLTFHWNIFIMVFCFSGKKCWNFWHPKVSDVSVRISLVCYYIHSFVLFMFHFINSRKKKIWSLWEFVEKAFHPIFFWMMYLNLNDCFGWSYVNVRIRFFWNS